LVHASRIRLLQKNNWADFYSLLATLRELQADHAAGQSVAQVRGFAPGEQLCTPSRWRTLAEQPRLVLVSTQGHARAFAMAQMASRIESPVAPQIDGNAAGWPKVVLGQPRITQ